MNIQTKSEIITQITMLLSKLVEAEEEKPSTDVSTEDKPVEMLTVRECTELVKGITVRQLVKEGKIPYIRVGESNRGKILIRKSDMINYFNKTT
ncbi:MAG: helix-turn-helix domain-containing protein [Clostridium sp.]|nr:helix-turn-helix domain-containing protein [Clostridium sp.]MCM1547760.1 helix-turn-helix domain-containing protein [Ruminococcus sp.]